MSTAPATKYAAEAADPVLTTATSEVAVIWCSVSGVGHKDINGTMTLPPPMPTTEPTLPPATPTPAKSAASFSPEAASLDVELEARRCIAVAKRRPSKTGGPNGERGDLRRLAEPAHVPANGRVAATRRHMIA
mmetsp:Transcript_10512/g.27852  ORF Transcript_10512/g.27852 Transcript_10512/m.27852 type:complete len:133 (+) Transcript_10512:222-620(+)